MSATSSRPNSQNISQTKPVPFESPVITKASDNSGERSPEESSISTKFNFPKASCGDKSIEGKNTWYPVFVDGGDLGTIRSQFCADAVATKRKDTGVKTVQLASFTSLEKANDFAKAVGGDIGQPTAPESAQNTSTDSEVEPESEPLPSDSSPSPVASSSVTPVTLNAFHWKVNSANMVAFEGQVTNNSDQPIRSLEALAEFYTSDGKFITSASTYMDINPLMPGQTTPFKGYETFQFEMETVKIRLKTFNGEISYTDAR